MAAKYFVWGEGVWREIDVVSGRVTGWRRRARFVYVRGGRLLVARRRPVLRALEALAVGQPSAAADGPRLAYRSKSESRTKRKHEKPAVPTVSHVPPSLPVTTACEHHHCCAHTVHRSRQQGLASGDELEIMCATNNTRRHSRCTDDTRPAGKRNAATQCAPAASPHSVKQAVMREHNSTAPAPAPASPDYSSAEEFVSKSVRGPSLAAHTKTVVNEVFGKTSATKPPAAADENNTGVTTHAAVKFGDQRRERARKRTRTVVNVNSEMSADESASSGRQSPFTFKELIVSDADVALLRGFVARTCPSALGRFDADQDYKCMLLRAINPLVHVEPCARLARLLGPAPPRPPRRRASADTDKENKDNRSSLNKLVSAMKKSSKKISMASPPPRLGVSERDNKLDKETAVIKAPKVNKVASDPPRAKPEPRKKAAVAPEAGDGTAAGSIAGRAPPGTHVISKRASQPAAKEYSNLEDHAIVAWLSSGSRACLVSGNRVWRDLQDEYKRLTGRERSWHSLRNRYLRYILPALGALRLPPADVSRLRAAAATGAIKTKNRLATRRHSALKTPVRGASWRRPQEGASSDDTASVPVDDATGPPSPKRRSPRSRPPQSASKDTSNKDDSGDETVGKAGGSRSGGGRARSPRYSQVTRLFALRRRRTTCSPSPPPVPPRSPPPAPPPTRSRRLFNPNTHA